jgi:hypothetical protein
MALLFAPVLPTTKLSAALGTHHGNMVGVIAVALERTRMTTFQLLITLLQTATIWRNPGKLSRG